MQRSKVPLSNAVEKRQKQETIEALNNELRGLQGKVNRLKVTKEELDVFIDKALSDKNKRLELKLAEAETQVAENKADGKALAVLIRRTENESKAVAEKDLSLDLRSEQLDKKAKFQLAEIKDKKTQLEDIAKALRAREKDVVEKGKQVEVGISNLRVSDNAMAEREAILSQGLNDLKIEVNVIKAQQETVNKKEKEADTQMRKALKLSASFDQKEAELIDAHEHIVSKEAEILKKEAQIKQSRMDLSINKMSVDAEKIRFKNIEKDMINRESQLRKKEKLFNNKIGG